MDDVLEQLKQLMQTLDAKIIKKYNLLQTERIIHRLCSFTDCNECRTFLDQFGSHLKEISADPKARVNKGYLEFIRKVTDHLYKGHKLITEGYYTSLYLAIGLAIGLPIGMALGSALGQMAYISIGLPLGMCFGVAIGSSRDAQAKKDGLVI